MIHALKCKLKAHLITDAILIFNSNVKVCVVWPVGDCSPNLDCLCRLGEIKLDQRQLEEKLNKM